jgi:hypothetical protein
VRFVKYVCALCMVLLPAIFMLGQAVDRHLSTDQARPLYKRSAYAHGYIHGYEDGFHYADIDVQMGHGERPLKDQKDYRASDDGYRHEFGDKHYFSAGYRQGFEEGYSDSISGRTFRAIGAMGRAAKGLTDTGNQIKEREFDEAFSRGYVAGHERGISGNLESADFDDAASLCQSQIPRDEAAHRGAFCDAFTRGFSLGFADAQASNSTRDTQTAQK